MTFPFAMHICAWMRTTIELRDDLRVRLIAEAARRGLPGFSALIEQAVIQFLDTDTGNARAESISRLKGSMRASERRAAELEIAALRKKWR